ncbi:sugar transferase [Ramlibacter algicola]|uniref:Sugar transferase n=1 Tax=Ramlibacter algicola TaxID=2795217 RepID=A0A934PZM5_9BURK|nr:sugar transferase [Ramlibacter algicola]MBK0391967.1 sugar transferase [Ramlibacter algicola]
MLRTEVSGEGELTTPLPLEHRVAHITLPLWLRATKRAVDVLGAAFFLIGGLPCFLVIAAGVWLSSPGPIFYVQKRAGRGGRSFDFYKFRSMRVDSDDLLTSFLDSDPEAKLRWQRYQKIEKDPRVTAFGQFIRRTSLDELPQFWNVLKGDMSLVGPRPCMPQQRDRYGVYWHHYCAVKPGLTGLWQVSGRNRLTYRQRVELDAKYVETLSPWGDFFIFFKTIRVVLGANDAH